MRGQSSIVSELILIAISMALVATVLGVVNKALGNLVSLKFPLRPPTTLGVYELLPGYDSAKGKLIAIILIVRQPITITAVQVYYGKDAVCTFDSFVLSSSVEASSYGCRALVPAGYYGQESKDADDYDALCPGALYFKVGCDPPVKAVSVLDVDNGWYSPEGAPGWATVGTFTPSFVPLGNLKCETYLANTSGTLEFVRRIGLLQKVLYNGTDWLYAVSFKAVRLYKGTFTVLLWCPSLDLPLDDLKVVLSTDAGDLTVRPPKGGLI